MISRLIFIKEYISIPLLMAFIVIVLHSLSQNLKIVFFILSEYLLNFFNEFSYIIKSLINMPDIIIFYILIFIAPFILLGFKNNEEFKNKITSKKILIIYTIFLSIYLFINNLINLEDSVNISFISFIYLFFKTLAGVIFLYLILNFLKKHHRLNYLFFNIEWVNLSFLLFFIVLISTLIGSSLLALIFIILNLENLLFNNLIFVVFLIIYISLASTMFIYTKLHKTLFTQKIFVKITLSFSALLLITFYFPILTLVLYGNMDKYSTEVEFFIQLKFIQSFLLHWFIFTVISYQILEITNKICFISNLSFEKYNIFVRSLIISLFIFIPYSILHIIKNLTDTTLITIIAAFLLLLMPHIVIKTLYLKENNVNKYNKV